MHRFFIIFFCLLNTCLFAQKKDPNYFTAPVNIQMLLTGNYGELRSNHFHSGIDIKTEGKTGLPVFAVADGYVSRISVSPYGFGHALYVDHPNGTTSVYGHLDSFSEKIEKLTKDKQYQDESFTVNFFPKAESLKVFKGEQIAFSGNSGSSGGPHVHFEIRDTKSQIPLNPLTFDFDIKDNIKPKVLSVFVYPVSDDAVVDSHQNKKRYETVFYSNSYHIKRNPTIPVYGKIGFGIQALDYLDGSWSKCGIYKLDLKVDGISVYGFTVDRIAFDKSRYLNSHVDYEQKVRFYRNVHKLWKEPGNKLNIYHENENNGVVDFSDNKVHTVSIEISDANENKSTCSFKLLSVKPNIELQKEHHGEKFSYDDENDFETKEIELKFPDDCFYSDFYFDYQLKDPFEGLYSSIHEIHNKYTPVHKYFSVRVKTNNLPEELENKALLAFVNEKTKRLAALGGEYKNGWVEGKIRGFGDVAVTVDTIAPTISSLSIKHQNTLIESSRIRFKIKDDLSGIKDYKGTIDGKWVLFEYDAKNSLITYRFDKDRFTFNKNHELELIVSDMKDNQSVYKASFYK